MRDGMSANAGSVVSRQRVKNSCSVSSGPFSVEYVPRSTMRETGFAGGSRTVISSSLPASPRIASFGTRTSKGAARVSPRSRPFILNAKAPFSTPSSVSFRGVITRQSVRPRLTTWR